MLTQMESGQSKIFTRKPKSETEVIDEKGVKRVKAIEEHRSDAERQASAKMHCLYGVPRSRGDIEVNNRRTNGLHAFACSVVYDLRNYNYENLWGPFQSDGLATVDWERIEAIMVILNHNVSLYTLGARYAYYLRLTPVVLLGCNF